MDAKSGGLHQGHVRGYCSTQASPGTFDSTEAQAIMVNLPPGSGSSCCYNTSKVGPRTRAQPPNRDNPGQLSVSIPDAITGDKISRPGVCWQAATPLGCFGYKPRKDTS